MSEPQLTEDTFTRVCRKCSTQSTGSGKFCPNCGKGFERGRASRINKKMVLIGAIVFVLVAGSATGLVLKNRHDNQVEAARVASVERAEAEEAADTKPPPTRRSESNETSWSPYSRNTSRRTPRVT